MSRSEREELARAVAAASGTDVLLCADPANVHWLTGVSVDVETGPSPFAPPPVVLLERDTRPRLIASADDVPAASAEGIELVTYEGFTSGALRGAEHALRIVTGVVADRAVAVDSLLARGLAGSARTVVDVAAALSDGRAVKDAEALAAIRAALAVADAGQLAVREAVAAGRSAPGERTEVELYATARRAMDTAAAARVPVLADLVSGLRTAGMGGAPSARAVRNGELVLCDLAPRVDGVWGDSCATLAVGEPGSDIRAAHRRVADALDRAMEAVRPGARAAEVDAAARAGLDYPHHTGHGIGGSYHEEPRLVPGSTAVLREGMVIALEPGFYAERFGVRLEHVVRVTADGCEDLSTHRLEL